MNKISTLPGAPSFRFKPLPLLAVNVQIEACKLITESRDVPQRAATARLHSCEEWKIRAGCSFLSTSATLYSRPASMLRTTVGKSILQISELQSMESMFPKSFDRDVLLHNLLDFVDV